MSSERVTVKLWIPFTGIPFTPMAQLGSDPGVGTMCCAYSPRSVQSTSIYDVVQIDEITAPASL